MTVTINRTSHWYGTAGAQPEPDVVLLHTTETSGGVPGYSGGAAAPHATIVPAAGKGIVAYEHVPDESYSKSLRNLPGGVETNRRGVLQYELSGTCDPKFAAKYPRSYFWPAADDVVLESLAEYLYPHMIRWGIPFVGATMQAYPASAGARRPTGPSNLVRFSVATWLAFQGICGHQHAPENVHGDPGLFPIARLVVFLLAIHARETGTPPSEEDELMAITVLHPTKGIRVPLEDALWSMWYYILQDRDIDLVDRDLGLAAAAANVAALSKLSTDVQLIDDRVVAAIRPAIEAAAAAGGTPAEIADAVVAALSEPPPQPVDVEPAGSP